MSGRPLPVLTDVRPLDRFRFSPSSVDTFVRCPTKWAFQALGGLREPQGPAAAFGELVHAHREAYYKTNVFPEGVTDDYTTARLGLRELPVPRPGDDNVVVEGWVTLNTPQGRGNGKIDVFVYDQGRIGYDPLGIGTTGIPLVLDHKTTSDINKYAKTEEDLRKDTQTLFYGAAAVGRMPESPFVDFCWSYMQKPTRTKPGRHRAVRLRMTSEEVLDGFSTMLTGPVQQMLVLFESRASLAVRDVQRNVHACGDFGGCAFRAICPATDVERVAAQMTASTPLEEKVKIMTNQNGYNPNATTVSFPAAPHEGSQLPFPPAPQYQQAAPPPAPPQYTQPYPGQQPQYAQPYPGQQPQYAQPYPGQQPPAPQYQQAAPPPAPPQHTQPINPTQVLPPDAPQVAPDAPAPEKPKRGRGRPKKGEQQASEAEPSAHSETVDDQLLTTMTRMADVVLTLGVARDPEPVAEIAYLYAKALIDRANKG